jgi:hypothetical protein
MNSVQNPDIFYYTLALLTDRFIPIHTNSYHFRNFRFPDTNDFCSLLMIPSLLKWSSCNGIVHTNDQLCPAA